MGKKLDVNESYSSSTNQMILPWISALVWPCMLAVPLAMTTPGSPLHYTEIFHKHWYEYDPLEDKELPKPLGLSLGLLAVAVGQVLMLCVFGGFKFGYFTMGQEPLSIQSKGARPYVFSEGVMTHLAQPEGFVLLFLYLAGTWMGKLMPNSYYSFEGGIEWVKVFGCLVAQDGIQYTMHRLEHDVSPAFYKYSHKPHHKFTNPRLFDAFNGSVLDTICMILLPLYATANIVHCNVWTYMAFGSMYANWLTLIHSEYTFPWDNIFHVFGFGTPADHHVHHAFFKYNYGHLFMWFDQLGNTYKHPSHFAPKAFNRNV
mmetsp:Transcript_19048/g.47120  ORF Transcript_19048/g.47120 Transcript_19048/m.47120 type:complete len:315 (+) Transcript_19048:135-1079(+)|eukprot:CAMPEP_0113605368 /NCGR_PEP_ID=MMETSP0017_2-20120614/2290_1 /TAXON_ID=2856 /ORGANISM="Cylindrotheca closterium" /LENGTH=314 /DNA_ID=CAMNT_0000513853 /DNA_START=101 /DNA_END=1045 /DNA_ORIENTATION=- /assembly_acc=CAM_ASM_000147